MKARGYAGEQFISYHDESYLPKTVHLRGHAGDGVLRCDDLTPLGSALKAELPKGYEPPSPVTTDERDRVRRGGPFELLRTIAETAQRVGLHLLAIVPFELAHVFDDLEADLPCVFEFQLVEMEFLPTRSLPWDGAEPSSARPPLTLLEDTSPAFAGHMERAHEHLAAGDVFEIVLSRRFRMRAEGGRTLGGGESVFRYLGERTSLLRAPYRFGLAFPRTSLVGASPELLVRVCAGKVIARPISGSLRLSGDPAARAAATGPGGLTDEESAEFEELLASEKEKSELDMLVDLARHDLHRVCHDVKVEAYREALVLETVAHTQATVSGTLRDGRDALDAFFSCLNAGTLVGAPKRKAMEIIADLEGAPRGYYGGNLIHMRPGGDLRATILIRTCVITGDEARVQAGATVLIESDPRFEFWECGAKARGLLGMLGVADLCFQDGEPPAMVQGTRVPDERKRRYFDRGYVRRGEPDLDLLLVDNEDSFTFNLEALVASRGCRIQVIRNRMPMPDLWRFDGLVLSPGPSAPSEAGHLLDYVRKAAGTMPVLGVCLGFQAMVDALGGELGRLEHPLHGKAREITKTPAGVVHPFLAGLPPRFEVARYHSLHAKRMPESLVSLASDDAGVVMALAAGADWPPFFGVQFHPESFLTGEAGVTLVDNWLESVRAAKAAASGAASAVGSLPVAPAHAVGGGR